MQLADEASREMTTYQVRKKNQQEQLERNQRRAKSSRNATYGPYFKQGQKRLCMKT